MEKSKILVVDDEPDIVETVSFMLQARNFDVITASDGLEGLAKVRTEHPDLILLDIMMPVMDGYEVCTKLRKDKDMKNIPVIMLTARGENEAVIRAHKSGADDYIVKPFSLPTLVSKLNKLLDRQ
ncbi:MAG: two-component system, OmpR family, alkaline phosphatase synthesis response regulator PhoP [Candidatus Poribacteria bacterium]|nr:two-component system, OmpR family, alkaline phosphatase synthesis response regulator PhoP [Candidatus Poribacteria bacterium]